MARWIETERVRHSYDAYASDYDKEAGWYERLMLGDGRSWACSQARGDVLEVAIGTGLNLPYYPPGLRLRGIDLSAGMLTRARARANHLTCDVQLVQGDAQALPFADAVFDTVVCTLGLSSMPDDRAAIGEMHRLLRPRGHLVLLGHVASRRRPLQALQRGLERFAAHAGRPPDRQTRQVAPIVREQGFSLVYLRHSRGGVIERVTAVRD